MDFDRQSTPSLTIIISLVTGKADVIAPSVALMFSDASQRSMNAAKTSFFVLGYAAVMYRFDTSLPSPNGGFISATS
jgi:hypothetical protein